MAMLTDVQTRLVALSLGVPVKLGRMPDSPDAVVVLYETSGIAPDLGFGNTGIRYEHAGLAVHVRGAVDDYAGPRAIAELVQQDLAKVQAVTLTSTSYQMIKPQGSVFPLERDGRGRHVFVANFIVDKRPS